MATQESLTGQARTSDFPGNGWLYGRAFQDINGHIWEIVCMDEGAMPEEMKKKK